MARSHAEQKTYARSRPGKDVRSTIPEHAACPDELGGHATCESEQQTCGNPGTKPPPRLSSISITCGNPGTKRCGGSGSHLLARHAVEDTEVRVFTVVRRKAAHHRLHQVQPAAKVHRRGLVAPAGHPAAIQKGTRVLISLCRGVFGYPPEH